MAQKPVAATAPVETAFAEVVTLIHTSRQQALQAVNTELIDLYWRIGQYLHHKIESDGWAKGTVVQLAAYIAHVPASPERTRTLPSCSHPGRIARPCHIAAAPPR